MARCKPQKVSLTGHALYPTGKVLTGLLGWVQAKKAEAEGLRKAVEALRDVRRWSEAAELARIWIPWAQVFLT